MVSLNPTEETLDLGFETTVIPGILLSIVTIAAILLQLIFRLFVYLNLTQNSSNMLSLKSVIILCLYIIFPLTTNIVIPSWFLVIGNLSSAVKFFAVPLVILFGHEEAKAHFNNHNQSLLNLIPIANQSFQWLQNEITQVISMLKNRICGPSNQVGPVEIIELEEV